MVILNLADWIERREKYIGPYADHIIHSVRAYEAEIERLRKMAYQPRKSHDGECDCIQCVPF